MGIINKEAFDQKEKDGVQAKFGKRLAQVRNNKGITQEKFSFEVGVDRTYISYIERGKRNPSLYMLWRMAKALKVNLSVLIDM